LRGGRARGGNDPTDRSADRRPYQRRRGQRNRQSPCVPRGRRAVRSLPPILLRLCPRSGLLLLQPGAHRQSGAQLERAQQKDVKPPMPHIDAVVCGLGVMGSAALWELTRRGMRALGIERFTPGHDHGSSHGATRIIRLAYFEHPSYVPLLRRTYELWSELEQASGSELLHVTCIAEMGAPEGALIRGVLASVKAHALRHELLTAQDLMRRFPAFRLPPHYAAVVQPDGGFLEAEPSVQLMLTLATQGGAVVRSGERVRIV